MRATLLPCRVCFRHVRLGVDACPFCGTAVPASVASRRPALRSRTTRAGGYRHTAAFAALAAAACGGVLSSSTLGDGGEDGPSDAGSRDSGSNREAASQDGAWSDAGLIDSMDEADGFMEGACDPTFTGVADARVVDGQVYCGDAACEFGHYCSESECGLECPPAPPYGIASVDD
jgi:hypothetical protein